MVTRVSEEYNDQNLEEVAQYMTHCRQLKFEEAPDYTKYKKAFKDLFFRCGFEHEFIFDWTIQRYRVDKPSTSSHDGADEKNSMSNYFLSLF